MENEKNCSKLREQFKYLELEDFLGLAQIAKVNIFTEENKIRRDFQNIEDEIVEFYKGLNRETRNKFLRRIRQITSYNQRKLRCKSNING